VPTAPTGPRYQLELLDETATRPAIVPPHAYPLRVISNNELLGDATGLWDHSVEPPRRSTRHLVLALPASETYATGDHLAVYARNSNELVARVAARLGVAPNQLLRLTQLYGDHSHLPVGEVVTLGRLLSDFVELQDVARRSDIALLIEHTDCPWTQQQLQALIAETDEGQATYQAEILAKRVSLFDLLVRFPAITLPLELFLEHCGPIRPRYYSISSAALATPRQLSLTVGVVHEPAWSGTGQYKGLASSYLAGLQPGDTVFGFVRTPNPPFAPPADPTTPLILIGPGTGIAPLRGFVEERAHQRAAGSATGPTLLFVGCRHPDHDWYYRTEFEYWAAESVVTIRAAFSQLADYPYRYVQDALVAWGAEVWELVAAGAAIYVCGDGIRMAPAVRQAFGTIYQQHTATSEHEAEQWLADLDATGRYRQDVFGPSK
jgi:cytochrome P450 / NADPH-cytochrome P450 reductase